VKSEMTGERKIVKIPGTSNMNIGVGKDGGMTRILWQRNKLLLSIHLKMLIRKKKKNSYFPLSVMIGN